jgi:menaquinone-dependent protoporphyrinogen oxidase
MRQSVLVAYATKRGSTREVAEAIAEQLASHGLETTLSRADEVAELAGFDGVVLGGSLYMGRWHADARSFLKRHRTELEAVPLVVFALGPLTMEDSDAAGARKQLDRALAKTPDVEPVSTAIFGGVIDPEKLRFPFSHLPASDARDWDAVRTWADEVAKSIAKEIAVPA